MQPANRRDSIRTGANAPGNEDVISIGMTDECRVALLNYHITYFERRIEGLKGMSGALAQIQNLDNALSMALVGMEDVCLDLLEEMDKVREKVVNA